jgi:kynureninase
MKTLLQQAQEYDKKDTLKVFKSKFHIPKHHKKPSLYFCGNSLGCMPKKVSLAIQQELKDWSSLGVEGHWKAKNAWLTYHQSFSKLLAPLCGALEHEVVAANSLTVNLHLALASFYKPTKNKFYIVHEAKAFSSDLYALQSVVKQHGLDPKTCLIAIENFSDETYSEILKKYRNKIALVFLGGVNYYSGEVLNMDYIADQAHKIGAKVGFDLAHAIGNIPLQLHLWNVDFAVWCSYKYLNAGPGATGGLFIHERHGLNAKTPRLAGWWGHDHASRFQMPENFKPIPGAEGWQLSNAPVFNMIALKVSLELFKEAKVEKVFKKGQKLSTYLIQSLKHACQKQDQEKRLIAFEIITPEHAKGCQVSLKVKGQLAKGFFDKLSNYGVVADYREPNVIRLAPVPLYNTYKDIYDVVKIISQLAYIIP